jgi:DNA-binding HxlR family transcriptional regulator
MDRRSYHQHCGLAKALDVVGERWTLLVVRNLLLGPQRYSDLLRGLPGITTNLLAKRLREMQALGLVEPVQVAGGGTASSYRLTARGAALEPAVHALARWGWAQMSAPAKGDYRSFDFLMVALRRLYRGGVSLRAELVADGVPYRIILTESHAEISRGDTPSHDLRVKGTATAMAQLFLDETPLGRVPSSIEIEGTLAMLRTLVGAFAKPAADARAAVAERTT